MKFSEVKRFLDRKATYYWEKREDGRFALVNSFTLKTATGCRTWLDALNLQTTLITNGYSVAKLTEGEMA